MQTPSSQSRALVIGAGLGGLSAAMRLGARGYRVTVVDRLDRAGGRGSSLTRQGHRFDLGPTIVTVPAVFERLWQACGRDFHADVELRALDPYYEIRWPDGSHFSALGDEKAFLAEVERLSPQDVEGAREFLADSETRYWFGFENLGRRSLHRLWDLVKVLPRFAMLRADRSILRHAARRVHDPRLRMALSFHPLFIGGDPRHVTSMYALVSHLEGRFGVHYAMGGVQAMADAMVRVIFEQGGRVQLGQTVSQISVENDRAAGVILEDGSRIEADLVVSNADPGHTYDKLLADRPKSRWTPRKLRKARWSMGLFVWYFGTKDSAALWQDVGHHTILNGPRYEGLLRDVFTKRHLADDMSLYLHRPSVTDPSVAPAGDDTFYVLSPVPNLGGARPIDWAREAETYKVKVAKVLEDVLPGFQARITAEEVFTPETFRNRYLSPYGAGFSLEPRILQSAWFRPHVISEELEGLYLVGAGTHPGAGLPGVVSSAEVLDQVIPDAAAAMPKMKLAAE